jgi:hypothetical protein
MIVQFLVDPSNLENPSDPFFKSCEARPRTGPSPIETIIDPSIDDE